MLISYPFVQVVENSICNCDPSKPSECKTQLEQTWKFLLESNALESFFDVVQHCATTSEHLAVLMLIARFVQILRLVDC